MPIALIAAMLIPTVDVMRKVQHEVCFNIHQHRHYSASPRFIVPDDGRVKGGSFAARQFRRYLQASFLLMSCQQHGLGLR